MFKNYLYVSGTTKTLRDYFDYFAGKTLEYSPNATKVLDIACNDGTLLEYFKTKGHSLVAGMDPANNLLNAKKRRNLNIEVNYFNLETVKKKFFDKKFDLIFARNVIAHFQDPNNLFEGAKYISKKNSVLIIEVPHLLTIFNKNQYDNIFHEHVGYHSLISVNKIAENFGFKLFDCEIIESQGKSLRCFYIYNKKIKDNRKIQLIIEKEKKILKHSTWKNFNKNIYSHKKKLFNLIKSLKIKNKTISAYGASGKGQSLLQICDIDHKYLDFIYDKSKKKIGKFLSYGKLKIKSPKEINYDKPDYILLLSWNLKNEIIKQEKKYLSNGGKFIIPFPHPKII
jgi:SAM-dependent methyltransferase